MDETDRLAIRTLRGLALDMPRAANSGHTGTALSLAPLGWLLYSQVMRHNPADPGWPNRDRLVLSSGHACVLLYGLLYLCGYDLTLEDLKAFRQPGSRTPGHPESWVTPGVDASTGPLGQGLAMAVGMAVAERFLSVADHYTYVICSDGDLMEGISSEASSWAGHQRLARLIVFYDDNLVTIDGPARESWSENVAQRYESYGWHVVEGGSGEDWGPLQRAIREAQASERPTLIRIRTVIGFPSPGMQGKPEAHSPPFSLEEIRRTKELLGLDPEQTFEVPSGFPLARNGCAAHSSIPLQPGLPADWQRPKFQGSLATRVASGHLLQQLAREIPNLIGGSADLAGSTNSKLEGWGDFGPRNPTGRNLRYGVREHAMAAITNGIVQHGGLRAFCSTYFAFSDYMKPALRLAALSGLASIFLWTHDSLGLGEDGPTHQPVEHLAALRALPNFLVLRPADANETAEAWEVALAQKHRPVGLVLSRQALPCLPSRSQLTRGAYLLVGPTRATVTLLGSGSEVHVCLAARDLLEARGVSTRVVSMPCWELFDEQTPVYRQEVLGDGLRIAVEAGASLGWHRWVGDRGAVLGLDRFGASGPGEQLLVDYGFHATRVLEIALERL